MAGNEKWIFTWGYGHIFPNKYIIIEGSFKEAREKMVEMYGDKWAFQYPYFDKDRLESFGITPLPEGKLE